MIQLRNEIFAKQLQSQSGHDSTMYCLDSVLKFGLLEVLSWSVDRKTLVGRKRISTKDKARLTRTSKQNNTIVKEIEIKHLGAGLETGFDADLERFKAASPCRLICLRPARVISCCWGPSGLPEAS